MFYYHYKEDFPWCETFFLPLYSSGPFSIKTGSQQWRVFLRRHDTHFPKLKFKTYTEKSTLESWEMKTSHPSDQLLKLSDGGMRGGRKPLKRSKKQRKIKCHSMTNPDVNYEIKLSEDFSRTAKGFDSSCSPKTTLITCPAPAALNKQRRNS